MIDSKWLLERMQGDQIVVRMLLDGSDYADIRIYTYWNDDMAYIGCEVKYEYVIAIDGATNPRLRFKDLGCDPSKWFDRVTQTWNGPWRDRADVVCTAGAKEKRPIHPGHPRALTHLARCHGMLMKTALEDLPGLEPYWAISISIVDRRLDGLIRSLEKQWTNLIGQP